MPQAAGLRAGSTNGAVDLEGTLVDSLIFSINATFPIFLTMLLGMFLHRSE